MNSAMIVSRYEPRESPAGRRRDERPRRRDADSRAGRRRPLIVGHGSARQRWGRPRQSSCRARVTLGARLSSTHDRGAVGLRSPDRPAPGIEDDLVDVAPPPILPRLEGADDRVLRGVEVLAGVPVLGVIAAADVAADHAQPQMDPGVAQRQALLAPLRRARGDFADLI
jgi:hypothetical protein